MLSYIAADVDVLVAGRACMAAWHGKPAGAGLQDKHILALLNVMQVTVLEKQLYRPNVITVSSYRQGYMQLFTTA